MAKAKSLLKRIRDYHEDFLNKTIKQLYKARIMLFSVAFYGAVALAICMVIPSRPSFNLGIVDMQVLLGEEAERLAKTYPDGTVPAEVMDGAINTIKTTIQDYGKRNHLHLFAKGALLSDQADYTPKIQAILKVSTPGKLVHE